MNNIGGQSERIIPIAPGPIDSCRGRGRRHIARGLSPRLMYVIPVEITHSSTNGSNSATAPVLHIKPHVAVSK